MRFFNFREKIVILWILIRKGIYNYFVIFFNRNKYRYILILRCNRFFKMYGELICVWIYKYLRKMYIVEKLFLKYINYLKKKINKKFKLWYWVRNNLLK